MLTTPSIGQLVVAVRLKELFGLDVVDLQIAKIDYSPPSSLASRPRSKPGSLRDVNTDSHEDEDDGVQRINAAVGFAQKTGLTSFADLDLYSHRQYSHGYATPIRSGIDVKSVYPHLTTNKPWQGTD